MTDLSGPDAEAIRRHESHLVGQIYHLIEANQALEEQLHRLSKATEIADVLRGRRLTPDTFELPQPRVLPTPRGESAWLRIDELLRAMPDDTAGLGELKQWLGVAREQGTSVDPDWLAHTRTRLLAAEQALAYLDEQTRDLDALRREKASIMDGVGKLEQNIEDLWKSLNEKTTHIQRLEKQLNRIWGSAPYRVWRGLRNPFGRGGGQPS